MAALNVPAGRWMAWAKMQLDYVGTGLTRVRCQLAAVPDSPQKTAPANSQAGYLKVGAAAEDVLDVETFALSAAWNSTSSGASFRLRCNYENGAPVVGGLITANRIRIMALSVGRMRFTPLTISGGLATANPGFEPPIAEPGPVGGSRTASVERAVMGHRQADLAVPAGTAPQTVATLPLPQGNWWARATFTVLSLNGAEAGVPVNDVECRLVMAPEDPSGAASAPDQNTARVHGFPGWEEDRHMMLLDAAGSVPAGGAARLQCAQTYGIADLVLRDIRVSAVKAGTLEIREWDTGTTTTIGSGAPVIIHLIDRDSAGGFPLIGLDPARWLLMAKVNLHHPVVTNEFNDCRFTVLGPSDEDWSGLRYRFGTGVPFQIIHQDTVYRDAGIDACEADGGLRWAKFTAIRLAQDTR
jgi:hypothetical protein